MKQETDVHSYYGQASLTMIFISENAIIHLVNISKTIEIRLSKLFMFNNELIVKKNSKFPATSQCYETPGIPLGNLCH